MQKRRFGTILKISYERLSQCVFYEILKLFSYTIEGLNPKSFCYLIIAEEAKKQVPRFNTQLALEPDLTPMCVCVCAHALVCGKNNAYFELDFDAVTKDCLSFLLSFGSIEAPCKAQKASYFILHNRIL